MARAFLLALCLAAAPAAAAPWAEGGDRQLRQDVELLKAAKFIRGPVSTWPLPWSQIMDGVEAAEASPVRPHIRMAARRLRAHADIADQRMVVELTAAGTNRPALVHDFGFTAREQGEVAVKITRAIGRLHVSSGIGYRYEQRGDDYHFEPGQAVFRAGNWGIYGGYVRKWWGPGNDGALTIGDSARPFPKLGVTRLHPYKPEPKFLRWIGPWRLDFFGGVLTETRADSKNPIQFGMQFSFEPAPGLEFNLNRLLMICGGTRSSDVPDPTLGAVCDTPGVIRALFPFFPGIKPGDSLAGFAVSYTRMIGPAAVKVYYDVAGEDKDSTQQFDQVGQIGGGSITVPLGGDGVSAQIVAEYTDTVANFWLRSREFPGSFYNNTFYFSGKTYRGAPIGHSIDGDSQLLTIAGALTDAKNRRFYGSFRRATINSTEALNIVGFPANRVSLNREDIDIATVGAEVPTRLGDIRLEARYMTDQPNTPDERDASGELELSFRTRF